MCLLGYKVYTISGNKTRWASHVTRNSCGSSQWTHILPVQGVGAFPLSGSEPPTGHMVFVSSASNPVSHFPLEKVKKLKKIS